MGHTEVYATATKPNPAYMQTQALIPLTAATGISTEDKIVAYARILEHDQASGAYRPVASTAGWSRVDFENHKP
jgi:hypothetical protein